MSCEFSSWAMNLRYKNPEHKAVLISLADNVSPGPGTHYPSLDEIELYTGMDRATIIKAIVQMDRNGVLLPLTENGLCLEKIILVDALERA